MIARFMKYPHMLAVAWNQELKKWRRKNADNKETPRLLGDRAYKPKTVLGAATKESYEFKDLLV